MRMSTVAAWSAVTTPAFELLDADVREQVRRSGIDPLTEVETVRRLARSAVRAHDDRSLSGAVRPVEDPERVVAELTARVAGFGALQPYLDDPTVEEVWINEPARVFVARDGRHELTTTILTTAEVRDLVERMLKTSGRRVDVSSPFVDAMLPSGHRLHVVLDGITRGFSAVKIRERMLTAGTRRRASLGRRRRAGYRRGRRRGTAGWCWRHRPVVHPCPRQPRALAAAPWRGRRRGSGRSSGKMKEGRSWWVMTKTGVWNGGS
jgi:hypothetical protein